MAGKGNELLVNEGERSQRTDKSLGMPQANGEGLIMVLQKRPYLLPPPPYGLVTIRTAIFT